MAGHAREGAVRRLAGTAVGTVYLIVGALEALRSLLARSPSPRPIGVCDYCGTTVFDTDPHVVRGVGRRASVVHVDPCIEQQIGVRRVQGS